MDERRRVAGRAAARRRRRRSRRAGRRWSASARLVGPGQVGPQALPAQLGVGQQRLDERHELVRARAPTRCMPVSTLRWTRTVGATGLPGLVRQRVQVVGGVRRSRSACQRTSSSSWSSGCSDSTRIGARMPACAQRHPLLDERHAQALGAGLQRGPGHRRGAVAVAVGLDDDPQRGRGHGLGQHARRWRRWRRGPPRPRPGAGDRPAAITARSSTPGHELGQVGGDQAPRRAARRGRAVQPGAGRRGLERRDLLGEERADDARTARRPCPAVASRSSPAVASRTRAGRLGHDGRRSLQQHDRARRRGQLARRGQAVRPRACGRRAGRTRRRGA